MNANPVTGVVYVRDLTLTKGNIYFNFKVSLLVNFFKWILYQVFPFSKIHESTKRTMYKNNTFLSYLSRTLIPKQ